MNKYTIIFLVIILILVILWLFYYKSVESFSNRDDNYLYPIKGLTGICEKENLLPSHRLYRRHQGTHRRRDHGGQIPRADRREGGGAHGAARTAWPPPDVQSAGLSRHRASA